MSNERRRRKQLWKANVKITINQFGFPDRREQNKQSKVRRQWRMQKETGEGEGRKNKTSHFISIAFWACRMDVEVEK